MARRRSRAKKPSFSEGSDDAAAAVDTSSGRRNARALQTLPSAVSTQRLARTQSKIAELIDHAHQHVDLAMRLCSDSGAADDDDAGSESEWPSMASTAALTNAESGGTSWATKKKAMLLRVLLRKKQKVARLADSSGKGHDDARYNRLQHGYTVLAQHLRDTDTSRKRLEDAMASFRGRALAMESVLPPEPRDSRVMVTSLHACFAQSADLVDELVSVLTEDVAAQTQTKISQLTAFKETLERRDRLHLDMEVAKQQLEQFQKLTLKQRSAIPGAYDLELAQRKHEYNVLRRRVAAITVATEHVFQFYAHLDHCIVDPEMSLTHRQLTRFFEKHARVFEKNVK